MKISLNRVYQQLEGAGLKGVRERRQLAPELPALKKNCNQIEISLTTITKILLSIGDQAVKLLKM